ncbi:MAG: hypothetical protein ISS29_06105 [Candidatus Marinimicrobia bacterium]|nr:hypothetical protein [Candidatus Neomarinimicrobiota bacterium]
MPALNESSFRQRIEFLKEILNDEKQSNEIISRLQEKGVECSILIPLFEIELGFDTLKDIQYEYTSNKRFDRFDFLLDGRIICEAKKLNSPLHKLHNQIQEYIFGHNDINYGILSNGTEYTFLVQKSFIKEFLLPEERFQITFDKKVFHLLTISVFDQYFYEIIKLFSKDQYHQTFSNIAKFALTRINKTKITKICDDKILNSLIQKKVTDTINIQHGKYLKDIQEGKIFPGDKLSYEDEFVKINLTVEKDGRVKLEKGSAIIKNMMQVMNNEFSPMIDLVRGEWRDFDQIFIEPSDAIRAAIERKRLSKKYEFKRIYK